MRTLLAIVLVAALGLSGCRSCNPCPRPCPPPCSPPCSAVPYSATPEARCLEGQCDACMQPPSWPDVMPRGYLTPARALLDAIIATASQHKNDATWMQASQLATWMKDHGRVCNLWTCQDSYAHVLAAKTAADGGDAVTCVRELNHEDPGLHGVQPR